METAPTAAAALPAEFALSGDAEFVDAANRAARRAGRPAGRVFPAQGFALFPAAGGGVAVRAVIVTAVFGTMESAQVVERFWRCPLSVERAHVLPLDRVATGERLPAKLAAYAATLSAPEARAVPQVPVMTAGGAALSA